MLKSSVRRLREDLSGVGSFAAGNCLGGAASLVALTTVGALLAPIPSWLRVGALGLLIVALLAFDLLTASTIRLPQRRVLIPQHVFGGSFLYGCFRFGIEFGAGFRTFITSGSAYMLAVFACLANPTLLVGTILGVGFGLGRTIAVAQHVLFDRDDWQPRMDSQYQVLRRLGSVVFAVWTVVFYIYC